MIFKNFDYKSIFRKTTLIKRKLWKEHVLEIKFTWLIVSVRLLFEVFKELLVDLVTLVIIVEVVLLVLFELFELLELEL